LTSAIDAHRLRQLLAADAQLVEVLSEAEYREDHLPGAINIPLEGLDYCWDGL
jgi:rhodanese-related sulfurtransferase